MTRRRLIVYDLDGTLVDTQADIASAVNHMLTALGVLARSEADIRRFVGRGLRDLIQQCLGTADPARLDEGEAIFEAYYRAHLADASRPYPGALELLQHFEHRLQAVLTNKPDPFATELLAQLDLTKYFAHIVTPGPRAPKKPDPAGLLALMDALAVTPDETLLIGDSAIDVETGLRARVQTVMVTHGFADEAEVARSSPHALVRNFHELLQLAKSSQW